MPEAGQQGGAQPPPPPTNRTGQPGPSAADYRRRRAIALTTVLLTLAALAATIHACTRADRADRHATHAPTTTTDQPTPPGTATTSSAATTPDTLIDATLARMPLVAIGNSRGRRIALTFDDGPSRYTGQIMRILAREQAPATFFWLGNAARNYPNAAWATLPYRDYTIGDHTQGHLRLTDRTRQQQASDIDDGATRLRWETGATPRLFRPPYGAFNRDTLDLLARRHMLMVLWSVDSEDYSKPGTATIVRNVLAAARPGAIVLMHDGGGDRRQTIAALPTIIRRLRAKHYRLVTIPTLLKDPPPLRQPQYTLPQ
ncbi:MAG: polysaccharide deacetylase family protein [Patulibacter sp.]